MLLLKVCEELRAPSSLPFSSPSRTTRCNCRFPDGPPSAPTKRSWQSANHKGRGKTLSNNVPCHNLNLSYREFPCLHRRLCQENPVWLLEELVHSDYPRAFYDRRTHDR